MVGIFLILPGRIQSAKAQMKEELIAIGEENKKIDEQIKLDFLFPWNDISKKLNPHKS